MFADYHIHTSFSPDGQGTMQEYIEKACEKGLCEIGFSDHILTRQIKCFPRSQIDFVPNYVADFLHLKKISRLPIRMGVEMDFVPDDLDGIRNFIAKYPFDYVLGSVHLLGEWEFDNPNMIEEYTRREIDNVYGQYFELVKRLCSSRLFDTLAHPDLIKIFGFKPQSDLADTFHSVAEEMRKADICAEINTSGLRRPCHEQYPSQQFLDILHKYEIPITFGSDAHRPGNVGCDLYLATRIAREVGYNCSCRFDHRKRTLVPF